MEGREEEMRKARMSHHHHAQTSSSAHGGGGDGRRPALPSLPLEQGETRNWKLLVDPFLKKGLPKLYRFNGVTHGGAASSAYNVKSLTDPRSSIPRFYARSSGIDLSIPPFQIDENYTGTPPAREISFFELNDNVNEQFLKNLCSKCGEVAEVKIHYHPTTKKHLGVAKVIFGSVRAASACVARYNCQTVMGNKISCCLDAFGQLLRERVNDLTDVNKQSDSSTGVIGSTFATGVITQSTSLPPSRNTSLPRIASWSETDSVQLPPPPPTPPTFPPMMDDDDIPPEYSPLQSELPAVTDDAPSQSQRTPSAAVASPSAIVEALTTFLAAARSKGVVKPIADDAASPAAAAKPVDTERQKAMVKEQLEQLQALALKQKQQAKPDLPSPSVEENSGPSGSRASGSSYQRQPSRPHSRGRSKELDDRHGKRRSRDSDSKRRNYAGRTRRDSSGSGTDSAGRRHRRSRDRYSHRREPTDKADDRKRRSRTSSSKRELSPRERSSREEGELEAISSSSSDVECDKSHRQSSYHTHSATTQRESSHLHQRGMRVSRFDDRRSPQSRRRGDSRKGVHERRSEERRITVEQQQCSRSDVISENETAARHSTVNDTAESSSKGPTPVLDEKYYSPLKKTTDMTIGAAVSGEAAAGNSLESRIQSILSGAKRQVMQVLAEEKKPPPLPSTPAALPAPSHAFENRDEDEMSLSSGGGDDQDTDLSRIQPPATECPASSMGKYATQQRTSHSMQEGKDYIVPIPNAILPPLPPPPPSTTTAPYDYTSFHHGRQIAPQNRNTYGYHQQPPMPAQFPHYWYHQQSHHSYVNYGGSYVRPTGHPAVPPRPPQPFHRSHDAGVSPKVEADDIVQRRIRRQLSSDLVSVLQKDIGRKLTENVLFPRLEKWWSDVQKIKERQAFQYMEGKLGDQVAAFGGDPPTLEDADAPTGLGLKASMPKLPTFRRKSVRPISPARSVTSEDDTEQHTPEERTSLGKRRVTARIDDSDENEDVSNRRSSASTPVGDDESQITETAAAAVIKVESSSSAASTSTTTTNSDDSDDDDATDDNTAEKTQATKVDSDVEKPTQPKVEEEGSDVAESSSVSSSASSDESSDDEASSDDENSNEKENTVTTVDQPMEINTKSDVRLPVTSLSDKVVTDKDQHAVVSSPKTDENEKTTLDLTGTTASEKGAPLTDTNFSTKVLSIETDDSVAMRVEDCLYSPLYFDHCYPLDPRRMPKSSKMEKKRTSDGVKVPSAAAAATKQLPLPQIFPQRSAEEEARILRRFLPDGLDLEDVSFLKRGYDCLVHDASVGWPGKVTWVDPSPAELLFAAVDRSSPPPSKRRRQSRAAVVVSPTPHRSGCARSEGYYKIEKAKRKTFMRRTERVFERTKMQSEQEMNAARQQAQIGREARLAQRRLLTSLDFESDLLKVNQLRFRKKLIKFGRSHIHGWGLFALEEIQPDEMIVEYVGQKVRINVAERRELHYERKGIGSSYLFRVDGEQVIDATKSGNLARFINHSCSPNCYAKIITVDGDKRIVIYSKEYIGVGAEITYDYKFPLEDQKISCLCQAPNCRGTLN